MMKNGYTLIEVMIALMVFAIIATISASVMYHVFDIRKRVALQANQLGELQLAIALLEHDTTQFVPRTVSSNMSHTFSSFTGQHQYMEFTRGGLQNPNSVAQRSSLKRVAYLCRHQQLIRRSWDMLDSPDRHEYEDKILLENLSACFFEYVSSNKEILAEWRAYTVGENQKTQATPSGVQVTINPAGWGNMTLLFVVMEGLYGH